MLANAKHNNFIAEWLTNGHNASEAYKAAYPNTKSGWNAHGARLIAKDSIKQEIARKQAVLEVKTETTVESVQAMYKAAYDLAEETKQSSSMVSAATGIARLYGMDKDNQLQTDTPIIMTPEEIEEATAASDKVTRLRLAGTA